jgi:hypothetical protein
VRWAFIAALLFATAASGYEEEAKLPAGEWMILEGRSTEAVTWYRARYAENAAEWREGLAEALRARASDLLALEQPEEALPLLEEAEGLTRDPERLGTSTRPSRPTSVPSRSPMTISNASREEHS